MRSTRSALRLGSPLRFHDRWQGRLAAFELDDDWLVANIILSRGIFRPTEVKLPFSAAADWDDDAVSLDCTSREAFGRQIPPVAIPPRPLSAATPLSVSGAKLAGALVERISRRVTHLLLSRGLFASDERIVPVAEVSLEGGVLKLVAQADALAVYRRDSDLIQAARDALAAHPYLTADDRRGLTVDVADGTVNLSGNVRTARAEAAAYEAASSVSGPGAVRVTVINDRQLEIDIGRALDAAGFFRYGRIYVRAALGEVTLGGFLTNTAPRSDIVKSVSGVPGVLSVEDRMEAAPAPSPQASAEPQVEVAAPPASEA